VGTLVCRAARQRTGYTTDEVTPAICFSCVAGKTYREVGCDAISPRIEFFASAAGAVPMYDGLFCEKRRRDTTVEFCLSCGLVDGGASPQVIARAKGIFERAGFASAWQDLTRAAASFADGDYENTLTRSLSCVESVMRTCHEGLKVELPAKKQASDLWRSTRTILRLEHLNQQDPLLSLLSSVGGIIVNLALLRNALGDAHGRGVRRPEVPEYVAELALNTASTAATFLVRRFVQLTAPGAA
jgi:hypothetical protein